MNRLPLATHAYTTAAGTVGKATPVGFEPTRGDPIGLAGRRISHSAKVSVDMTESTDVALACKLSGSSTPPALKIRDKLPGQKH